MKEDGKGAKKMEMGPGREMAAMVKSHNVHPTAHQPQPHMIIKESFKSLDNHHI